MQRRRMRRIAGAVLLAAGLLAAAAPADARRRRHPQDEAAGAEGAAGSAGGFDYYLLSLSIAPSFCRLSARNGSYPECQALTEAAYERTPLTIHGLWPNRARVSVNQQPHDCGGQELGELPGPLESDLQRYMPGGARLEQHEWQTHGTCSGLQPDGYFGTAVRLAQRVDAVVGGQLRDHGAFGTSVRVADLVAAVSAQDPALGAALVVSCSTPRGGGPTLIEEIRVTFSKSFEPIPAADAGLGQNSGCPNGAGVLPRVAG